MADGRGARFRALRSGVSRSADLFELQAHAGCARYRTRSPRAHRRLRALAGAAGAADFLDQRATLPPAEELLERYQIRDLSAATLPRDFERNPRIHRCFEVRP